MSKYIQIKVSASVSTDFFIEVADDASAEKVEELAKKEVILPHTYPDVLDKFLKTRMGIQVQGLDSMLRSWNVDEVEYIIENTDGGDSTAAEGEQPNA